MISVCAWYLRRPKEGAEFPEIRVSELLCGCWELYQGPLEEQPMLLTTETSLKFLYFIFYFPAFGKNEMHLVDFILKQGQHFQTTLAPL